MRSLKLHSIGMLIALFLSLSSFCQESKIQFETTKLSDHAFVLTRTWGAPQSKSNIGVVVGEKGLLIINASFFKNEVDAFFGAIQKISKKPIKWIINSNWDFYNVASNAYFKDKDVVIISHENVSYQNNVHTQLTFKDRFSLDIGTESIVAYRSYGHSFGHINIHLKNANTTFMSDSYRSQWVTTAGPYGLEGHFKGIDLALDMGNDATKYVPGNVTTNIVCDKNDLLREKKKRTTFSNRVVELKKQGKSNTEILADEEVVAILKSYELYPYIVTEISDWVINPVFFEEQDKKKVLSLKDLEKYVGIYTHKDKNDVEIFIEDGELYSRSLGAFYMKLVPVSATHFWYNEQDLNQHQVFEMDNESQIKGFTIHQKKEDQYYLKKK